MRVTVLLAIALTIAFATAASARHSTIPPITDTIRGVGTAALPGAPHGVSPLMCLGENNARNSPLLTSLVIDMDKQTVAGDGIGCHNDQPCPITEVTESYIRFKVSDAWSGEISRISGALTVTRSKEEEWQTIYDLICKPAYDRQDHTGTRHRRPSLH